nr:Chain B, SOS [Drosophila melanogaster]
VPPPVPPRRR